MLKCEEGTKENRVKTAILLFAISACLIVTSVVGGFTNVAWTLMGRPNESYPELLFVFFYLPTSVLLLIDASLILWRFQKSKRNHLGFKLLWTSTILKIFGLALTLDIWIDFGQTGPLVRFVFGPLAILIYAVLPTCFILSTIGFCLIARPKLRSIP
jgi:hypothetical protein